jgi:hypothetical protein
MNERCAAFLAFGQKKIKLMQRRFPIDCKKLQMQLPLHRALICATLSTESSVCLGFSSTRLFALQAMSILFPFATL